MKVVKFGGTSVGSVEGILNVKKIVEAQSESTVVVVSAFSGVTDQLYRVAEMASKGDDNYIKEYQNLLFRHIEVIEAVVLREKRSKGAMQIVKEQLNDLSNILRGVFLIKDISPRINDTIVSYGEAISSIIIANTIEGAAHIDARDFIKTVNQFDKHIVDFDKTNALIKANFDNIQQTNCVWRIYIDR
jgi:bifunctional aspartokinase / homoserine dehydrogenase 1